MARIVCKASELKSDRYRFKHTSFHTKSCSLCEHAAYENVEHMLMSCPYNCDFRTLLSEELSTNNDSKDIWVNVPSANVMGVLLGGKPEGWDFMDLVPVWCIAAKWIHKMYEKTIKERAEIG